MLALRLFWDEFVFLSIGCLGDLTELGFELPEEVRVAVGPNVQEARLGQKFLDLGVDFDPRDVSEFLGAVVDDEILENRDQLRDSVARLEHHSRGDPLRLQRQ